MCLYEKMHAWERKIVKLCELSFQKKKKKTFTFVYVSLPFHPFFLFVFLNFFIK